MSEENEGRFIGAVSISVPWARKDYVCEERWARLAQSNGRKRGTEINVGAEGR